MPQFHYDPYENRYAGQIAESIAQQSSPRARAAELIAQAQARAAQNIGAATAHAAESSGQGWALAAHGIGQAVAGIPGQIQQSREHDAHMAAQAQEGTLRGQQIAENTAQAAQRQTAKDDIAKLDEAFSAGGSRDTILNAVPAHLRQGVLKQFEEADKLGKSAMEAQEAALKARGEHYGYLGAQIRQSGYSPTAALAAIHQARETYAADPDLLKNIDAMRMRVIEDPDSIKTLADSAILGSSYREMLKPERPMDHDTTKELVTPSGAVLKSAVPKAVEPAVERRSLDVQAADALKAGDKETYQRLLKVKKEMGVADNRPSTFNDHLTKVEHKGPDGKTIIEWVPLSQLAGKTFEKGTGATTENRLALSQAVNQTGNDIITDLSNPDFAKNVGPAMGRYATIREFIGNPPPEYSELAGKIESYSLASMGVHGMRSVQGSALIAKLLDQRHTPQSLAAAIKGLNQFSAHFLENEGRKVPEPAAAPSGPAVGTVRTKGGETRKWNGSEWVPAK